MIADLEAKSGMQQNTGSKVPSFLAITDTLSSGRTDTHSSGRTQTTGRMQGGEEETQNR